MKRVLLVPSAKKGNGSGHLVRCFSLARELGAQAELFLSENPGPGERGAAELALSYPAQFERTMVRTSLSPDACYDLVVLDRRQTGLDELERWARLGPVLCLDEGGSARQGAEYLVDILPGLGRARKAFGPNASERAFLDLPKHRRAPPERIRTVLVSFGGEDPAGLTDRFVCALLKTGLFQPGSISVVRGPLNDKGPAATGIVELGRVQDLKESLASYDLVVCSFGLTAYEAAWAGCAVLLYNPSPEHDLLSRAAGFPMLPRGRINPARLQGLCANPAALSKKASACAPAQSKSLSSFLAGLEPAHAAACPVCGKRTGRVVARYERKTYLCCPDCKLLRMAYFEPRSHSYTSDSYFFDEYKVQYGKTYIEDLPNLRAMAASRLSIIDGLLDGGQKAQRLKGARPARTVLDVGCAYGAFVAEAQARHWHAIGSDLSGHAVEYVKASVGAPAFVADFSAQEASGFYPQELDCLTMWYVIEHFDRLGAVLDRVASLVKQGGVFAFSTPSASGVSARLRPGAFWDRSPDDHYTVLSPASVRGILLRYGFTVQRLRITGHHPERFPWVPAGRRGLRWHLAMAMSRALGLGDTFECYAIKTRAAGGRPKAVS